MNTYCKKIIISYSLVIGIFLFTSCGLDNNHNQELQVIKAERQFNEFASDGQAISISDNTVATTSEVDAIEEQEERKEVTLLMVGDMLLHMPVQKSGLNIDGSYTYEHLFTHVKTDIEEADIAIINEEVILGGEELGLSGYPTFNASYQVADAIAATGFNVVLHATNHTMDKGKTGFLNCLSYWKENYPDVQVAGVSELPDVRNDGITIEKNDITIKILNYTYGTNGMPIPADLPYAVNLLEEESVRKDIKEAKANSDFVVVCPHWGSEYQLTISEEQKMWTNIFLEEGVDLVIGTHPHVIEPIEWIIREDGHKMLVYYSLGNYINSTRTVGDGIGNRMLGAMAKVSITKEGDNDPIISDYEAVPLITHVKSRSKEMTTYKMEDYPENLIKENEIILQDANFSIEYCKDLWNQVMEERQDENSYAGS